jgi:hypothetical protein
VRPAGDGDGGCVSRAGQLRVCSGGGNTGASSLEDMKIDNIGFFITVILTYTIIMIMIMIIILTI